MSSNTEPRRGRTLAFLLALAGFVLCDGVALLALGNVIGFWNLNGTILVSVLAAGVACLASAMVCRRF